MNYLRPKAVSSLSLHLLLFCGGFIFFSMTLLLYARLTGYNLGFCNGVGGLILFYLYFSGILIMWSICASKMIFELLALKYLIIFYGLLSFIATIVFVLIISYFVDGNFSNLEEKIRFDASNILRIIVPILALLCLSSFIFISFQSLDRSCSFFIGSRTAVVGLVSFLVGLFIYVLKQNGTPGFEEYFGQLLIVFFSLVIPSFTFTLSSLLLIFGNNDCKSRKIICGLCIVGAIFFTLLPLLL